MSTVIKVENLSKSYHLGSISTGSLQKDLQSFWARLRGKEDPNRRIGESSQHRANDDLFWALRDVSFEVKQGEVLGILGRNGAGKSTLLKILSRITAPTHGSVKIRGRIASLLEVGTGFHPELTGRENVYLNGAILGMTHSEITRKFEEIVEFAGIEQFIDTPVKRYSSGMYVRLAFAVAAHLESEILLVDEVLAVGDMEFQKKCLGKMGEISQKGRTVLFISHSLPMIASLCSEVIILSKGSLFGAGNTASMIARYQEQIHGSGATVTFDNTARRAKDSMIRLHTGWVCDSRGETKAEYKIHEEIRIGIRYELLKPTAHQIQPSIQVHDANGNDVFVSSFRIAEDSTKSLQGQYEAYCVIPGDFLNDGMYSISTVLNIFDGSLETVFFERHTLAFNVVDDILNNPKRLAMGWGGRIPGVVRPTLPWFARQIL